MTTRTTCDYPECGRTAVWKVELSDIRPYDLRTFGSSFTVTTGYEKRTSVDTCEKHLIRVSFDPDEIAEFQKTEQATA